MSLPNNNTGRVGDWIQTYTGLSFWPLDPRADEVDIIDIAHSLSLQCRYNGHCTQFYSVAEHSVLVSQLVPDPYKLWGLLHDATEAYVSDVPRPLKRNLPEFVKAEALVLEAVKEKFGLEGDEPAIVKHFDYAMLSTERAVLMNPSEREWGDMPQAADIKLYLWTPQQAKEAFLVRYTELKHGIILS